MRVIGHVSQVTYGGHVESREIENVCYSPLKLIPKHFISRLGVQVLLSMANTAAARIRPIMNIEIVHCRMARKFQLMRAVQPMMVESRCLWIK